MVDEEFRTATVRMVKEAKEAIDAGATVYVWIDGQDDGLSDVTDIEVLGRTVRVRLENGLLAILRDTTVAGISIHP